MMERYVDFYGIRIYRRQARAIVLAGQLFATACALACPFIFALLMGLLV